MYYTIVVHIENVYIIFLHPFKTAMKVYLETKTVQAPQEPSPQESFVPVKPDDLRY